MTDIDRIFTAALAGVRGDEGAVTLPPDFQGLPGVAHGGSVLALFDAAAGGAGPRRLLGQYLRRVPVGAPLVLRVTRDSDALACRLEDASQTLLVDGRVETAPALPATGDAKVVRSSNGTRHPLPVSTSCFVCGTESPLGLRAALEFDDAEVRATWRPRPSLVRRDGSLCPAALTGLLDEAAFWLGALATGESGMTTELDVTVARPARALAPVEVTGTRALVRTKPEDPRYLETEVAVRDDEGVVATARITFVTVRGAARRLATALSANNPPDVIRRVFPAYLPR